MYRIDKQQFGYLLTFGGSITNDEMKEWKAESEKVLMLAPASFGVFVDMRKLAPLAPDAQKTMTEGQALYKNKGMKRSAVLLDNAVLTMQFKRLAKESGIYEWERYLDASADPNWKQKGVDWLTKGIDPDA